MKLSDAAVLGAATWKRMPNVICHFSPLEGKAGCFIQVALMAVGFSPAESSTKWAELAKVTWPWVAGWIGPFETHLSRIWSMNDDGKPFEQILAYVRQHEPPEPEAQAEKLEHMVEEWRDAEANTREA